MLKLKTKINGRFKIQNKNDKEKIQNPVSNSKDNKIVVKIEKDFIKSTANGLIFHSERSDFMHQLLNFTKSGETFATKKEHLPKLQFAFENGKVLRNTPLRMNDRLLQTERVRLPSLVIKR